MQVMKVQDLLHWVFGYRKPDPASEAQHQVLLSAKRVTAIMIWVHVRGHWEETEGTLRGRRSEQMVYESRQGIETEIWILQKPLGVDAFRSSGGNLLQAQTLLCAADSGPTFAQLNTGELEVEGFYPWWSVPSTFATSQPGRAVVTLQPQRDFLLDPGQ